VVVLCRLGRSRARKALAFSRPSRTDAWYGCLSVWSCSGWASFSAYVLSPYMYLAVYYLCHLQMTRSSSCPSPVTNKYARLFPSLLALQNLGSGGCERCGPWFATYDTRVFIKKYYAEGRDINKNFWDLFGGLFTWVLLWAVATHGQPTSKYTCVSMYINYYTYVYINL
jgi:hypothetical protein